MQNLFPGLQKYMICQQFVPRISNSISWLQIWNFWPAKIFPYNVVSQRFVMGRIDAFCYCVGEVQILVLGNITSILQDSLPDDISEMASVILVHLTQSTVQYITWQRVAYLAFRVYCMTVCVNVFPDLLWRLQELSSNTAGVIPDKLARQLPFILHGQYTKDAQMFPFWGREPVCIDQQYLLFWPLPNVYVHPDPRIWTVGIINQCSAFVIWTQLQVSPTDEVLPKTYWCDIRWQIIILGSIIPWHPTPFSIPQPDCPDHPDHPSFFGRVHSLLLPWSLLQ